MSTIALNCDVSGNIELQKTAKHCARCGQCNKKLGILGIKCRCGTEFCISHLQCEMHNCTYDLHKYGLDLLKKSLEVGKLKDKMDRI